MASEVTAESDAEALAAELRAAADELESAQAAVEEIGEDRLQALEAATNQLARILDQYEETATGSGDFEAYMECRMAVQELEENLDADVPNRDIFESVAERFDSRRLSNRDFSWAYDQLESARDPLSRLKDRDTARDRVAETRRAVHNRIDEIEDRIDYLETVAELGRADLDAPVEHLETPITTYNDAVTDDFNAFLSNESARTVIEFIETTDSYPLVSMRQPPHDLAAYIEEAPAGTEPIPTLLEYADYSRSKLDHYLDEPMELKRHVATHRTYLTRLDATPFTIEWPPPPANHLTYRARELVSVVNRFADDATVATLHDVRSLPRRDDYDDLRATARATAELDDDERAQLKAGAIQSELETLRDEHESLTTALESVD